MPDSHNQHGCDMVNQQSQAYMSVQHTVEHDPSFGAAIANVAILTTIGLASLYAHRNTSKLEEHQDAHSSRSLPSLFYRASHLHNTSHVYAMYIPCIHVFHVYWMYHPEAPLQ